MKEDIEKLLKEYYFAVRVYKEANVYSDEDALYNQTMLNSANQIIAQLESILKKHCK